MRRRRLELILRDFRNRLAIYPPAALREAMRALEKIELKRNIPYEPPLDEKDAVTKELMIAEWKEEGATDGEIAELLRRVGFS
jgi:hypothetical protein